jgi:hypothetical protein
MANKKLSVQESLLKMDVSGFEPLTFSTSTRRSNQLS